MNPTNPPAYNPAEDDNQGVVQLLAQAEESSAGVAQLERMNPVTAQGPEPIKEEVNEDKETNTVNQDILAEEKVEDHDVIPNDEK